MKVKSVVWSSMLDWTNEVCTTLFLGGCNFRCSYCHNHKLASLPDIDFEEEILPKLKERKSMINKVIISGGEPTYNEYCYPIALRLKEEGFEVGLHTNGSLPKEIERCLPLLSFIGMDLKTTLEGYSKVSDSLMEGILFKSIVTIAQFQNHEFRTTLDPDIVTLEDLEGLLDFLTFIRLSSTYYLQQYNDMEDGVLIRKDLYTRDQLELLTSLYKNLDIKFRGF